MCYIRVEVAAGAVVDPIRKIEGQALVRRILAGLCCESQGDLPVNAFEGIEDGR